MEYDGGLGASVSGMEYQAANWNNGHEYGVTGTEWE